jgi:hypothetical protein
VNIDLREGLVEAPGGLPTFASAGLEERARAIGSIASDSYEYLADLLGFRPQAQVLVVSEDDWPKVTEVPLYGLPNASNGTLAVAGTEAPFWSSFVEMAGPGAEAELATVYGAPDGVIRLGPFMDLIAVHEVAHLFHEGSQHFPRLWLQELFANVGLHAWVAERAPDQLTTLLTLPRLGAKASPETFDCRTRDDFERQYITMGGPNYVWFQFRLQLEAAALYDRAGSAVVRRLFEAFRLDDAALARRLDADVDPGLAAFSLAF